MDFTLIPYDALGEIAKGFMAGEQKYGAWNWTNGFSWRRLFASTFRHLTAAMRGEDIDQETGIRHLALVGCNVLMLLAHQLRGLGRDDRHVYGNSGG